MESKCVYAWVYNNTNEPFYVGCGSLNRARSKAKIRSKVFTDIIKNNECHYIILKQNLSREEAAMLERQVIKDYRDQGCDLINQTCGGEVSHGGIWTDEMRREYAERLKGENNPNYGNRWTDEMKSHLSEMRIASGVAKGGRNPRAKKVMCVETGVIFASKSDAKDFLGVSDANSSIWFCLKNPKRVAGKGKYHFVGEDMFEELSTQEKREEWLRRIAS